MKVVVHTPPPVEQPPKTYDITGLTMDEFILIRNLLVNSHLVTPGLNVFSAAEMDASARRLWRIMVPVNL